MTDSKKVNKNININLYNDKMQMKTFIFFEFSSRPIVHTHFLFSLMHSNSILKKAIAGTDLG